MFSPVLRLSWAAFLWTVPAIVYGDTQPNMPYDSTTTKHCTWWYDNYEGLTCDYIRNLYRVSITDMVLWNPSLTLTCGNWKERSYCVEVSGIPTSTSTSTIKSTTSTTSSVAPTSTVKPQWTLLGCYLDSTPPTLSTRTTIVGGDSVMTVEKCQIACYASSLMYAGLEAKSQCWCGDYVANELANSTDCNMPCAGNSAQMCGGIGRINVYKGALPSASSTTTPTSSSTTSSTITTPTATSPVSIDGLCGPSSPKKATCAGSAFGNCCSTAGQCGWTSAFCAAATCQKAFGTCTVGPPISLDGKCGAASTTQATCIGSTFGQCCSIRGNCGSTVDYCGIPNGCQAAFGTCTQPPPISLDGKCGAASANQATCSGSTFGQCCSIRGNCGTTLDYCGTPNGCQTAFGTCTPVSTDGKCGSASSTKASCAGSSFGQCCSVKGNCGDSAAFCAVSNACQPLFGTCTPTSTDGKCGPTPNTSCSGSSFGSCCSVKGNCGSTAAFCAVSNLCQTGLGICTPTSTDGKCGPTPNTSCSGSSFGNCCSVKGNCGSTSDFCGLSVGCQTMFGVCT